MVEPPPNIPHAICRKHNGLIRETGDENGKQFWCPIGKEIWVYTKVDTRSGFYRPLNYPKVMV